jgi:hypothetical protein
MMERMNFVMGNVCDSLDREEKHGKVAGTCTQDVRKVGADPKSNSCNMAARPRWADYEDFEEAVDDIGGGGFVDKAIGQREGFRHPRNQRDFGNRTRGQFGQRENFCNVEGHADLNGDIGDGGFQDAQPNTKRNHANDPLEVPIGPITRARANKLKEALNGLVQNIGRKMDLEVMRTS